MWKLKRKFTVTQLPYGNFTIHANGKTLVLSYWITIKYILMQLFQKATVNKSVQSKMNNPHVTTGWWCCICKENWANCSKNKIQNQISCSFLIKKQKQIIIPMSIDLHHHTNLLFRVQCERSAFPIPNDEVFIILFN